MASLQAPITALILTKNESEMIEACINSLQWCAQIIVLDDHSSDNTLELAQEFGVETHSISETSFAEKRTEALKYADQPWIFYLDADERVTPKLAQEIMVHVETDSAPAMTMKRDNIMFGTHFKHGGWGGDLVTRVFKRTALQGWEGAVHESPLFSGEALLLNQPLLHLTHRSTIDGLYKTADWTPIEAELLFEAGVERVSFFTLLRKGSMEFLRRVVFRKGYQDGQAGVIEGVIQAINKVLIYIQIWELQQTPSIAEKYRKIDTQLQQEWKAQR